MDVKSKKILVLEDDPIAREVVAFALSSAGFDVTTAAKAVDALVLARRKQFDLVITDYYLPDYPGTDFVRLLRDCDEYRAVPAILLTARADELNRGRLRDGLCLLVLPKTCKPEELLTVVFKCLAMVEAASSPVPS